MYTPAPFINHNNKSCILVRHNKTSQFYIEVDPAGLRVKKMNTLDFVSNYQKYDYPTVKIYEKYLKFATIYGASEEVLEWLGQIINITKEDKEMIKKKSEVQTTGKKLKKENMSTLLKRLIMEGELTDDQIFAAVQKAFPEVEDKRRCYVTEYRSILRRKGAVLPAVVIDMKKAKAKEKINALKTKEKEKAAKIKEKVKAVKVKEKAKADKARVEAKSERAKSYLAKSRPV